MIRHREAHITFGPFCLDRIGAKVWRQGVEIRMRSQVFQVIKVLASRAGREVGYSEMITEAWHGTVVSKHTVAVTVAEARRALGDYGDSIVYRPRCGYRLVLPSSDDRFRMGCRVADRHTGEGLE